MENGKISMIYRNEKHPFVSIVPNQFIKNGRKIY